ncbi:MAG: RNA 2',3'-cyclic phosphodiesterase [Chloroflexota bacterium]
METIRAFIAIELPAELRQELARLQASLKSDSQPRIKWANPDGIHLTLKFLGNIPVSNIDRITQAMTDAAIQITPFYLETEALGAFPNLKRVQVIWVGLDGETDKLNQLQQLIETNLVQLGFAAEQRQFKPHLTLARLGMDVSSGERQRLGELIAATSFKKGKRVKVDSINLIKSQLTREGAVYSRIFSAGLLK